MLELVPVAFLPEDHALAIAAMSYNGKLDFGLLGDYDAMPDLDELAEAFAESLQEMVELAREAHRREEAAGAAGARAGREELARREVLGRQAPRQLERLAVQLDRLRARSARRTPASIASRTASHVVPGASSATLPVVSGRQSRPSAA